MLLKRYKEAQISEAVASENVSILDPAIPPTQPMNAGKQRKAIYTAPLHRRRKLLVAPLAPNLRTKEGVDKTTVRTGDTVLVIKGAYTDIEGKVNKVDYKKLWILVDGVTRERSDGSQVFQPVRPSNVLITKLKKDKKRLVKKLLILKNN